MTIDNDFQSLTIVVKISPEFLNPHMTTKMTISPVKIFDKF